MIRNLKRTLALLLSAILLLSCMTAAAAAPEKKRFTVMLYLCGTDLESNNGQATGTLGDILQSRYNTDEINVIALTGGTAKWRSGFSSNELTVIDVQGRRPSVVTTFPQADMSNPDTLTRFLQYCYTNYPADQYVLTMWDHGGGPIHGLMQDELYENTMSMNDFAYALKNSPFCYDPLDLLIMHACLMSSAEVSALIAPYARYMVASQDSSYGFAYDFLGGMENDSSIVQTGMRIVDDTFVYNREVIAAQHAAEKNAVALIDLSKASSVERTMDAYFTQVAGQMNNSTFSWMSSQRRNATAFGTTSSGGFMGYDLVDLGDLVNRTRTLAPTEASALLNALDEAVVYSRSDNDPGCTGLTVYHPFSNKDYMAGSVAVYNELGFSAGYTDYMHRFSAMLTSTPLARWAGLQTGRARADKAVRTLFTLELTEEQAAHYGDSRFEALLRHEDGSYTRTFVTNDTALENNALTGEFGGNALYALSADGTILSPAADYSITENGTYVIPAELTLKGENGEEDAVYQALVHCILDETSRQLTPGRVLVWDETMKVYSGALQIPFAEYDKVKLTIPHRQETRNEDGTLLPFDQWTLVSTEPWESPIDESWHFALVDDTLDTASLCATFEICDSQNNLYSSDLITVKAEAAAKGATHVTYDDSRRVIIEQCSVISSGDQLMATLSLKNIADQETVFSLENAVVNGIAVTASAEVYGSGENWGLLKDEVQYAMLPVSLTELAEVSVLTSMTFDLLCLDAVSNETLATIPVEILLNYDLSSAE